MDLWILSIGHAERKSPKTGCMRCLSTAEISNQPAHVRATSPSPIAVHTPTIPSCPNKTHAPSGTEKIRTRESPGTHREEEKKNWSTHLAHALGPLAPRPAEADPAVLGLLAVPDQEDPVRVRLRRDGVNVDVTLSCCWSSERCGRGEEREERG